MQTQFRRGIVLVAFAVCVVALAGQSAPREQFAQQTGLDVDLVNVLKVDLGGTELTLTFVFINERTFQSRVSSRLSSLLRPYVGRNAVYVNASIETVADSFRFDPVKISVMQDGNLSQAVTDAWVEITPGFLLGRFEINPMGTAQGSGSEGILVMESWIDPQRRFHLVFSGEKVALEIRDAAPAVETGSQDDSRVSADTPAFASLDGLYAQLVEGAFSLNVTADLLGVDPARVRTMVIAPGEDEELRLLLVRLDAAVRDSDLPPELMDVLGDAIGAGGVMVCAVSREGARFSAFSFFVQQEGSNFQFFREDSFTELTPGFRAARRVEAGGVLAGVIHFESIQRFGFDPKSPFRVFYGDMRVEYP